MIEDWLNSRGRISVGGAIGLRPRVHPITGEPVAIARGQAMTYVLTDNAGRSWYLKRFLAGKRPTSTYVDSLATVVPRRAEFASAWRRRVVISDSLTFDPTSATPPGLLKWLDGCVLSPAAAGAPWSAWLEDLATIAVDHRDREGASVSLCEQVALLEANAISHRDLSGGNVLVNAGTVSLIDWDTMFHPDLPFQANTSVGSLGYMARWVASNPQTSWRANADRFALAIMVAEALTVERGTKLQGDGSLFRQEDFAASRAPGEVRSQLSLTSAKLADLFDRAWSASNFDSCPGPLEWADALGALHVRGEIERIRSLITAVERAAIATVLSTLRDHPSLEAVLSGNVLERIASLKTSADALHAAIETGDRATLAALAREGLVDRNALRPSVRLEVDQAMAVDAALDAVAMAVSKANHVAVREARQRLFVVGGFLPVNLFDAIRRTTTAIDPLEPPTVGTTPLDPPRRETPVAFDIDDIPERIVIEASAESTRAELQLHLEGLDWAVASASWVSLRARWPGSVTEADQKLGEQAQQRWGEELNAGVRF